MKLIVFWTKCVSGPGSGAGRGGVGEWRSGGRRGPRAAVEMAEAEAEPQRTNLERVLTLERIANSHVFVGEPREKPTGSARTHLFGGLIAAQSVVAASETVPPNFRIHSMHSYFVLAGDGRSASRAQPALPPRPPDAAAGWA